MEIRRFGLGLRFTAELSADQIWDMLFDSLPYRELEDCGLFMCEAPETEVSPEETRIFVVDNLKLSRGRLLYERVRRSAMLLSYLAMYRPFVQTNFLNGCKRTAFLGDVSESGTVEGGNAAYGRMRFSRRDIPQAVELLPSRMLIAGGPFLNSSAADTCRRVARQIGETLPLASVQLLPLTNTGACLVDTYVCAQNGRYVRCDLAGNGGEGAAGYIGVLPDYSAVIDESYSGGRAVDSALLGGKALCAIRIGCRTVRIPVGGAFLSDSGAGFAAVVRDAFNGEFPDDVNFLFLHENMRAYASSRQLLPVLPNTQHVRLPEAVLSAVNFELQLRDCSHVVWAVHQYEGGDARAAEKAAALAKQYLKRFVRIETEPGRTLDDAVFERITQLAGNIWK